VAATVSHFTYPDIADADLGKPKIHLLLRQSTT
jgi:hypothetical protein